MRFRLKTLFVIVALISLGLAVLAPFCSELGRRAEQMAALRRLGDVDIRFKPSFYDWFEEESVEEVFGITAFNVADDDLRVLTGLDNLVRLQLLHTKITDDGLLHLSDLPGLQWLSIASPAVTVEGAERFTQARPDVRLYVWTNDYSFHYRPGYFGPMVHPREAPSEQTSRVVTSRSRRFQLGKGREAPTVERRGGEEVGQAP
jgi:hypothetical protein